jgi:multidrug efflux system membrane fusion protein
VPPRRSISIVLVAALAAAGCSDAKPAGKPAARRPVQFPVDVRPVEARDVEYTVRALGTIDVAERVQVTARVAGVVDRVKFREGDVVRADQVLLQIDAARFLLGEREARAAVDRARLAIADAEAGLARREQADKTNPGLIPGEELETWRTKVATAKADLAERVVARDRAALDRREALVRAPIAGEIESRTIDTGAYVQPGTVLAQMVRREPMMVRFDVPEADSTHLGKDQPARFTVEGTDHVYVAVIQHVGVIADPASRMVKVSAEITDPARAALRAGGFAQVTVPIGGVKTAPVIPETAIRPSERGFLAYVVEGEAAHERVLELGLRTADGLVEVRKGLKAGEQLVVHGAEALRDGVPVKLGGTRPGMADKGRKPPERPATGAAPKGPP